MKNLCSHCEELAERVAWLEGELGAQLSGGQVNDIRRALNIRPQTAQMILALYRAKGRMMSNLQLWETIPQVKNPHADDDRNFKAVDVQICNARRALGPGMIDTLWGRGRALTPAGMARVRSCLGETA